MKCPKCKDSGIEPPARGRSIARVDACALCTRLAEIEYREAKLREAA